MGQATKLAGAVDSRYRASAGLRRQLNKVFPTHWSFLLGRSPSTALWCSFFPVSTWRCSLIRPCPRSPTTACTSHCAALRCPTYASALDLSFEVRGGLFVRQIHHWAALMFAASIVVHLARVFFTGAFRRPREPIGSSDRCC